MIKFMLLLILISLTTLHTAYGAGDRGNKYKTHMSGVLLSQNMSKNDYDLLLQYGLRNLGNQGYDSSKFYSSAKSPAPAPRAVQVEIHYSKPVIKKSRLKKLVRKRGLSFSDMALRITKK